MNFKKLAQKSAIVAAIAASVALPAQADVIGVYVGVQAWQNEVTGGFSQDSSLVDFNFDDKTNATLYVKIEHPVPLLPNVRLRVGKLEGDGQTDLTSNLSFGGRDFTISEPVDSRIELTNNDVTLYWELLDNDIVAFDFGLTAKRLEGDFAVSNADFSGQEDLRVWLPMGYAAVKVRMPFAGVYAYGDANYVSYDGSKVHDYEVGVGYDLMDNLALDIAFTAGYREVVIELDDVDGIDADLEFSGFFAGLEFHF